MPIKVILADDEVLARQKLRHTCGAGNAVENLEFAALASDHEDRRHAYRRHAMPGQLAGELPRVGSAQPTPGKSQPTRIDVQHRH